MSFILDALKKSESDRQRQSGPSLFEVKVAAPRRRLPVWAVAIAVLLGINIAVVSWMLLRHTGHPAPAAASSARAGAPGAVAGAPGAPPATPAPAALARAPATTPGAAPATGATDTAPAPGPQGASQSPAAPPPSAMAPASPPHGTVSIEGAGTVADQNSAAVQAGGAAPAGLAGDGQTLPLYQQLAGASGATLPELHLDLHVYAADPRNSYVMINMHRLTEGDSLPDGVQVIAIRPDGVVLSYRGTQFLLPRD